MESTSWFDDYNYEKNILTTDEVLEMIKAAVDNKQPYSLARFGHGEIAELSWDTNPHFSYLMEYYRDYAGITKPAREIKPQLIEAWKTATTCGVLPSWEDKTGAEKSIPIFKNINSIPTSLCSAFINYEIHEKELFWRILKKQKVIIVGRRASQAEPIFKAKGVSVVGTVGLNNIEELEKAYQTLIANDEWQIAILSAGIPATILAPQLANSTKRIALDIGHALDLIIDGSSFNFETLVKDYNDKKLES